MKKFILILLFIAASSYGLTSQTYEFNPEQDATAVFIISMSNGFPTIEETYSEFNLFLYSYIVYTMSPEFFTKTMDKVFSMGSFEPFVGSHFAIQCYPNAHGKVVIEVNYDLKYIFSMYRNGTYLFKDYASRTLASWTLKKS